MFILIALIFAVSFLRPSVTWGTDDLKTWLAALKKEAESKGIQAATFDAAFSGFSPLIRVLEKERHQPETTRSFDQYMRQIVSADRVEIGRRKLSHHRPLIEEIGRRYGVQPRFIVALWGIESDFGRNSGAIPVVDALATLAYAGRRPSYFRKELLIALRILDKGDIPPEQMKGSWAGAMGQCQFMPWSFSRRAVDFDEDGRRDIWHSRADIFASIANFLAKLGWSDDLTWGREVHLPPGFDSRFLGKGIKKDLAEWQALGVRRTDGSDLPSRVVPGSLVRPRRSNGRTFLVYDNFHVLMKWNNSTYFAIAVGRLADRIGG